MVRAAAFTAAAADLWSATTAIQLYSHSHLSLQQSAAATTASAQATAFVGDFQIFLALAAVGGLLASVALIYRRLHQAEAAAAAGAGNNHRLSDLAAFIFAAAGILELLLFVDDVGALARALGLAAARLLPAASIANFFLGMMLIILGHIRAGGEGGGGAAVAGDGPIQAPVWLLLLTKTAFAAAAALVCLMTVALYGK